MISGLWNDSQASDLEDHEDVGTTSQDGDFWRQRRFGVLWKDGTVLGC